jgi:DnaJ-domain-containing protein 1
LGQLFRSFFQEDDDTYSDRYRQGYTHDPDMQSAWEELDEFLKTGSGGSGTSTRGQEHHTRYVPPELKKDYETLQVPFGSDFAEVKKAYKRLITAYHPDRHPGDQERATALTQKINYAFSRIKQFEETGKV